MKEKYNSPKTKVFSIRSHKVCVASGNPGIYNIYYNYNEDINYDEDGAWS